MQKHWLMWRISQVQKHYNYDLFLMIMRWFSAPVVALKHLIAGKVTRVQRA